MTYRGLNMRIIIVIILLLVICCIILTLIVKDQSKKYSVLKTQYSDIKDSYLLVTKEKLELQEKVEIERRNKMQLAKKLSEYNEMSISDILHKLQNN